MRREPAAPRPVEHIAEAFAVDPVGLNNGDAFHSRSLWLPTHARGVFGGQVLAQALAAAGKTTNDADGNGNGKGPLSLHSVHSYFLAAGNPMDTIEYRVRRLRDGGRYATRATLALQKGKIIFIAVSSYHRGEPDRPSFQIDLLAPWAPPPGTHTTHSDFTWASELLASNASSSTASLPSKHASVVPGRAERNSLDVAEWTHALLPPSEAPLNEERFERVLSRPDLPARLRKILEGHLADRKASPIEIRDAVKGLWDENGLPLPGTRQAFWMRAKQTVTSSPSAPTPSTTSTGSSDGQTSNGSEDGLQDSNKLALAYASDFHFLGTHLKSLSIPLPGMLATIDHTVWFYRTDFDAHEWMLYLMEAQVSNSGRGLVFGRIYREDGALIAATVRRWELPNLVVLILTIVAFPGSNTFFRAFSFLHLLGTRRRRSPSLGAEDTSKIKALIHIGFDLKQT